MADDRFTIRHHADGTWEIADREFASAPTGASWQMIRMDIEEAERVVRLMNELDRRLIAKHSVQDPGGASKIRR